MKFIFTKPRFRKRNPKKNNALKRNDWTSDSDAHLINFPPDSRLDQSQPRPPSNQYWFFAMLSSMTRAAGREFIFNGNFHEAASSVLVLAQCLAILPVVGIKSGSAYGLRFTWMSFRTIYSITAFGFAASYNIFATYMTLKKPITFNSIVPLAFFSTTAYGVFIFIVLAREWPRLMQVVLPKLSKIPPRFTNLIGNESIFGIHRSDRNSACVDESQMWIYFRLNSFCFQLVQHWEFVEAILPPYKTHVERERLAYDIRKVSTIVLSVALVEHILNMVFIITNAVEAKKDPIQELFLVQIPMVFTLTELNWWNAILSKWFNIVVTFCWSFSDTFVMIILIGLASLFKQINKDLQRVKGQQTTDAFWILRRMQYRKVVHLVRAVDDAISKIIFVVFANNCFFVCVQIVRSLKPNPTHSTSFVGKVYFWFSLIFLITRTAASVMFASYIHDESKKPINVIRAIPRDCWCKEAYRFSEEVVHETIALSGMKFFFLTRKLILTVAATIATYELVLLQFNTDA